MARSSFCWIQRKTLKLEAVIQDEILKKTQPNKKLENKQQKKTPNQMKALDNMYMTYTNSRNAMITPFYPKWHLNYSVGNNCYSRTHEVQPPHSYLPPHTLPSRSHGSFLSEVAHTWTERTLIHWNLVRITWIGRGSVRELRNHKHFLLGGCFLLFFFFLKRMLKPTLNLPINLPGTRFGVSL